MAKLGQLLVQRGWASPEDVKAALRSQRATGGRLGTCLLESNAVTEDLLLKALSEQHRVPAAGVEDLRSVSEETVASLPAKLAVRCRAVPFRAFGTQVHVAMLDPRDLNQQDELAFALGKRVQPYVASEVRIHQALDRHYGDECPSRLATLAERLDRSRYLWRDQESRAAASVVRGAGGPTLWEHPEAALFGDAHPAAGSGPAAPVGSAPGPRTAPRPAPAPARPRPAPAPALREDPARPARPRPPRAVSVTLTEEERSELLAGGPGRDAAPTATPDGEDDTRPVPADAPPLPTSFAEVEERFDRAVDPDEVARLLVGFLGVRFERVALFKVLRDRVLGWCGRGRALDGDALRRFEAGFGEPSVFLNLRQGGTFFLGKLPAMAIHRSLARCWGGSLPPESLLLPVRIRGRLVTVIYLDRHDEGLARVELDPLLGLAASAAEAYERCILRKKKD